MPRLFLLLFLILWGGQGLSIASSPLDEVRDEAGMRTSTPMAPASFQGTLLAGAMRSATGFVEFPLIALMDRMATTGSSPFALLKGAVKARGVKGLWQGASTVAVRGAVWVPRIFLYQEVNTRVAGPLKPLYTSLAVAALDTCLLKPVDVIRIALTTATPEKPFVFRNVFKASLLYKDTKTIALFNVVGWGIYFGADSFSRNLVKDYYDVETLTFPQVLMAGSITTLISGGVGAPLRLIGTRLQAPGVTYSGLLEGGRRAWTALGPRGFAYYAGITTVAHLPGNFVGAAVFNWMEQQET